MHRKTDRQTDKRRCLYNNDKSVKIFPFSRSATTVSGSGSGSHFLRPKSLAISSGFVKIWKKERSARMDPNSGKPDLVSILLNFVAQSMTMRPNKLECLILETLSSQVLQFEVKARANQIGAPFSCFLLG